ncbi:hypothetical protein [Haliea sp. E17]|uniref:hypothetical protein n=1 Tax=Haliea sp. E17 TaxID=3401576 RepID=UPI003AB00942
MNSTVHAGSDFLSIDECWLDTRPAQTYLAAFNRLLPELSSLPEVTDSLLGRGVQPQALNSAIRSDLGRLAHAMTLLVDCDHVELLSNILPSHLLSQVVDIDYCLGHVGREVICPLDPLLQAWHSVCEYFDFQKYQPTTPATRLPDDLIFPSVQVVKAIQREDPSVEAVTIAKTFVRSNQKNKRLALELFYVGNRDGTGAQNFEGMQKRLSAICYVPSRSTPPDLPICHLALQLFDRSVLEMLHKMGQQDRSGLVRTYGEEISINPGDGSHNTKFAVRRQQEPSSPITVLEFVYFE